MGFTHINGIIDIIIILFVNCIDYIYRFLLGKVLLRYNISMTFFQLRKKHLVIFPVTQGKNVF